MEAPRAADGRRIGARRSSRGRISTNPSGVCPVGQEAAAGPEGGYPCLIVDLPDLEDAAGRGRIDPKHGDDASHIAEQNRGRVTELHADAVRHNDLVHGDRPPDCDQFRNPPKGSSSDINRSIELPQGNRDPLTLD